VTFFFIFLHVVVCIFLIIGVLLQSSKGGGLAGTFGGDSLGGSMFGGRGAATFLSRATAVLATMFMLLSIGNSLLIEQASEQRSLIQEQAQEATAAPSPAAALPGIPGTEQPSQPAAGIPAQPAAEQTQTNP
jgi:preprotein translocase subunit SecG